MGHYAGMCGFAMLLVPLLSPPHPRQNMHAVGPACLQTGRWIGLGSQPLREVALGSSPAHWWLNRLVRWALSGLSFTTCWRLSFGSFAPHGSAGEVLARRCMRPGCGFDAEGTVGRHGSRIPTRLLPPWVRGQLKSLLARGDHGTGGVRWRAQ